MFKIQASLQSWYAMLVLSFNSSPLDKMAAISQTMFWNPFSWMKIFDSLKFVAMGLIDNKSPLVQVMAWRRTVDKPLPGPMMTQFNDAYMWHKGEMS